MTENVEPYGVPLDHEDKLVELEEKCEVGPLLIDGASGNIDLERKMAAVLQKAFELFKKKQRSYGPGNIAEFGERGVLIRANDKIKRLIQLIWHNVKNPFRYPLENALEDSSLVLRFMAFARDHEIPEKQMREFVLSIFGSVSASRETIEDTWMDLAVYALIALVVRNGDWPE